VASVRVVVVEDHEQFRRFICSTLGKAPELQVVGIVSDGLAAVQKAAELQPDLILLDIGLPTLNGIEAARRIRKLSPQSKILFVSQESSADVVKGALATGARGYVVKTDAGSELLTAVDAVLRGEQFVGRRFEGHDFTGASDARVSEDDPSSSNFAPLQQQVEIARCHEVEFYSDDRCFLDELTQFVGAALKAGTAAVVVATESHRDSLLPRLQAYGSDIGAAIEQERYISFDVADALSTFMINGMPDPAQFLNLFGNLIVRAADAVKGEPARVAVFREGVHLLWAQGNAEAAIQLEKLGNQLAKIYDVDILCGYDVGKVQGGMDSHIFQRICAEHSAVHSR
jgi:DNA-binding NarL/FixJ family response regulator